MSSSARYVGIGVPTTTYFERFNDGGSFIAMEGSNSVFRIHPVKHWNNTWAWWAFRSKFMGGTTPIFKIAKANHYNMVSGERLCCWSTAADSDTWYDFDNVTIGASDLEFSNDSPFPTGYIYVSALPMYPFSRIQRKMTEWMYHHYTSDTASGSGGVIFTTTARSVGDGSGKTVSALPLYGFKISSGVGTKNTVVLTAYSHATETPGAYQLEGAIEWLLGGSAQATGLLSCTNFFVYPCLNPQGVWSGYFRSCPQNATYDHNRKYNDGTSGVLEDVDAWKAAVAADVTDVDAFFDFHSYMDDVHRFGNVINASDATHVAYRDAVRTYDANWYLSTSAVSDGTKDWINDTYASTLEIAPENGHAADDDVSDYKAHGVSLMRGLADFVADGGLPYQQTIFSNGYETGITGNGLWQSVERESADRFARVSSPNPVRSGTYAAVVEVHEGDDPNGERSEVSIPTDSGGNPIYTTEDNGTEYVAFSVRFPTDWQAPDTGDPPWLVFVQLHGPDEYDISPAISLEVDNTDAIYLKMSSGNQDVFSEDYHTLSESGLNKGNWIDFVLKIKYATGNTGSIDVYRRDAGDSSWTNIKSLSSTPTLQYKTGDEEPEDHQHYWKFGVYRQTGSEITSVLHNDCFTISSSFSGAVIGAFGS